MISFKPSNLPCMLPDSPRMLFTFASKMTCIVCISSKNSTQNSYLIPQRYLTVLDLKQHLHYFTLAG
ncbi:hypothetical protein EUGRSUZ_L02790 [Eucalyptus grandis]|uniref:Uncharacterized protein n=1 Tax=Eucalyptus grandis TaxID=71139 RepID=A0AAD9T997_EUCGR|nr:hypothetical protein EUGRSUZ_L02790 [Eucalyptus grandis]